MAMNQLSFGKKRPEGDSYTVIQWTQSYPKRSNINIIGAYVLTCGAPVDIRALVMADVAGICYAHIYLYICFVFGSFDIHLHPKKKKKKGFVDMLSLLITCW